MAGHTSRSSALSEKGIDFLLHSVLIEPLVLAVSVTVVAFLVREIPHFGGTSLWVSYLLYIFAVAVSLAWLLQDHTSGPMETVCLTINIAGRAVVCVLTLILFIHRGFWFEGHHPLLSIVPLIAMTLHLIGCLVLLGFIGYALFDMLDMVKSPR